MELIRNWLIGITCAAMVAALAQGLTPSGTIRNIGKITGGLVLLLAVVQPLLKLDTAALTRALTEYKLDLSAYSETLEKENAVLMEAIIAEQSAAYIVDKAAEMGLDCQVTVETGGEGDYPVPERVIVTGDLTAAEQEKLTRQIEIDFAIPEQRQEYQSESEGKG